MNPDPIEQQLERLRHSSLPQVPIDLESRVIREVRMNPIPPFWDQFIQRPNPAHLLAIALIAALFGALVTGLDHALQPPSKTPLQQLFQHNSIGLEFGSAAPNPPHHAD